MSRHTIVASATGPAAFAVTVREHVVELDQPVRAGGDDEAPTPLEMLSVALAGCIALYARKYCRANGLEDAGLSVEVKPIWREHPGRIGRFDVTLHLPDGFPEEHRDALEYAARECPVHHTLMHAPEIAVRLEERAAVAAS
jgi:putative redox protein